MALTDNLVAYYKLDESSGNATDATGNGHTLTNYNSCSYSAVKINNGVDTGTSNTNRYLAKTTSILSYSDFESPWSISGWFSVTTAADDKRFFEIGATNGSTAKIVMLIFNSSTINTLVYDANGANNYQVSSSYSTGTLYHYIVTYNSGSLKVYINNSLALNQSRTISGGAATTAWHNFIIGAGGTPGSATNVGDIKGDEIGIWTKELSSDERASLYNSGNGLQYPFTTTSIKSINGLAYGSVKSYNGLAKASIKSINGLA